MLFTTEIPIAAIGKVKGEYDFLIAPYMKKKGYKANNTEGYGIMDNGAYEFEFGVLKGVPKMPKHKEFYNVIPDSYNDSFLIQQLKLKKHGKDKIVFVPHANTRYEFLGLIAYWLAQSTLSKHQRMIIGINIRERWMSKNRFIAAFQRRTVVKMINKIIDEQGFNGRLGIHLLGSLSVFDLWICRKFVNVWSADSSLPIMYALNNKKIKMFSKKISQPEGFIDLKFTEEQMNLAQQNIDYIIKKVRL